jgi:twinkle protein
MADILTARHMALLEARGLDIELLARLGVRSSGRLGPDTVGIPYYRGDDVVGVKYRTISGDKKFMQAKGSAQVFYNVNCLSDPALADQPVIVVEGEADCWSGMQAGYSRIVSVPAGAPATEVGDRATAKYDFLTDCKVTGDRTIYLIAVDADGPGDALRKDLVSRLGARRCKWVRHPQGCKDFNDTLQRYGERGIVASVNRAQWMVGNVYHMSEIPPATEKLSYESGFPGLDGHYRLRLGDLCIVTGVPSAGKSAFIGDIACRMARRHRWPVCFASFEQEPTIDHRRELRKWHGGGFVASLDAESLTAADRFIEENFTFIVPEEDGDPASLEWLMERMAAAAIRHSCRLFVLDPWNEIEHDPPRDMTMTQYVGHALRSFRGFARKYDAHLIVAAHPAKMRRDRDGKFPVPTLYDISDSAMWANRADIGIVVHRDKPDDELTTVRILKSRYHDQIGRPGEVRVRFLRQRATYEAAQPGNV